MTTDIRKLYDYLNEVAPLELQMDYDNAGILTGQFAQKVDGVLVSLDCTEAIVEEAISKNCNVILCHHPIIFRGLKKLTGSNYVERTVIKAIKNDVAILAWHTNLDSVLRNGVNSKIAERLGLTSLEILSPDHHNHEVGAGMIGRLAQPMSRDSFFKHLRSQMELKTFKYTSDGPQKINKVALCGGAGSFLIHAAKKAGADLYLTGDIKYHEFFDGEHDMCIVDIGHYESEKYTIDLLHALISKKFSTFAVLKTEKNTNPVEFYQ